MRLSLWQVQVGVTTIVLVTTLAIVGLSGSAYARLTAADLSAQLVVQASERLALSVRTVVDAALSESQIAVDLLGDGQLPDRPAAEGYFDEVVRARSSLASMTLHEREPGGLAGPAWGEARASYDDHGQPVAIGVTRTVPIPGRPTSALVVEVDLAALRTNLGAVPVGRSGVAFLLEQRADGTRRIIAHPDPTRVLRSPSEGDDPVTRALADRIPPDLSELGGVLVPVRFEVDGVRWTGAFHRLGGRDVPPWVACTAVPENDLSAALIGAPTAIFAVGGLLLAIVLGLVSARTLSVTVGELEAELRRIAAFDLTPERLSDTPSVISEIDRIRVTIDGMKAGLRSFSRYVPTGIVRDVVRSGDEARLGATRREITILFADIAGFGALAESVAPERLMSALGDYLQGMNTAIESTDGTVCQYLGDVVMAFWGAPEPAEDHALRACRGALAMSRHAKEQAATARSRGQPALPTRFGLCSGLVLVGNIGAANRFNYGALGDAVNTAARIGGLNRIYGTSLLIGETTAAEVEGALVTRPVDFVRMKGKVKPHVVHELIGERGSLSESVSQGIAHYARGLDAYRYQRFDEAAGAFREALAALGQDGPSRVMIDRCGVLAADPPPPDWDGVFVMRSK